MQGVKWICEDAGGEMPCFGSGRWLWGRVKGGWWWGGGGVE